MQDILLERQRTSGEEQEVQTDFKLYIDESGELGRKAGSSKFFLITALSTANPKALKKRIWKQKAALYNEGWPKDIEIKGTTLWGAGHNSRIPKTISERRITIIRDMISAIVASPIKIHYSIANKARLADRILNAPYGVAYNYLAGKLITRAYQDYYCGSLHVVVDQRSKETHSKLKFDSYVETKLRCECGHSSDLVFEHLESHSVPGLQAVDFLSWGIFRYYEHDDSSFLPLIEPTFGYRDFWYPEK